MDKKEYKKNSVMTLLRKHESKLKVTVEENRQYIEDREENKMEEALERQMDNFIDNY